MTARGKRYLEARSKIDLSKKYSIEEAMGLVKEISTADFNETIEVSLSLGVNPSQNMVRGTSVLPNGTGKEVKVLAFASGEKHQEAEQAGADWVGGEDLAEKIEDGWLEFDEVVTTPDMMSVVGKLGRVLGPRGMMPSPKSNTVTEDIGNAVEKLKKGQVEFRTDQYGIVHVPIGKSSFSAEELKENLVDLVSSVLDQRPEDGIQGRYLQALTVSSTMGPGIKVEIDQVRREASGRNL